MGKYESLRKISDWIKNSSSEEFMGTFNKLDVEYSGPTLGDFLGSADIKDFFEDKEEPEEYITEEDYEQSLKDNN